MSTYQELRGLKVKYLAANPDPGTAGDVWYDSATFELKGFVGRAAWSAGANMIVGRYNQGGAGTQTAAFVAGGAVTPDAVTDDTYEYNGVGWSTGEDMAGTDRLTTACGTLTAGLAAGGWSGTANVADSEEYDGTDWAEGDNLNTARRYGGQFGIQTAAVLVAGATGVVAVTEEYNGSAWANGEDCNTAMEHIGAAGTLTAGLKNGGVATAASGATEEYNGTDWTSVNSMNTARRADVTFGTQTAAIAAGGYTTTAVASVEEYDGTSWTEIADLAAATNYGSGVGTNLAGMHTGGMPGYKTATEEYNNTFDVVTQGTWASGGNMNTGRSMLAGTGQVTAALAVAGMIPSAPVGYRSQATEEYNGTAWTSVTNYPTAVRAGSAAGTQTAAVVLPGTKADNSFNAEIYEYDGTNWTEVNELNTPRAASSSVGTQTAALCIGGATPTDPWTPKTETEEYDGTNWTAGGALPAAQAHGDNAATGTQTAAAFATTGFDATYDGSSWTAISATQLLGSPQTSMMATGDGSGDFYMNGGETPGGRSGLSGQHYNGTVYATTPTIATGRNSAACGGTSSAMWIAGGQGPPGAHDAVNTEEFTAGSTAETGSTIDFD